MVIFDRTDFGPSNISLSFGKCWINPRDQVFQIDYWDHSIEYDVENNKFPPLQIQIDTWCSFGVLSLEGASSSLVGSMTDIELLGHSNPHVISAIRTKTRRGWL